MNQKQFYKSKQWEAFRKVIIAERTDADGYVHCAKCGKPILKKYDLIIHHKQELSDANVADASVSLNPDNVECVCFKCHNKIHERFGFNSTSAGGFRKPVPKKVFIVYGAPCSGKSTFVKENADPEDIVVDMDKIWQMISVNGEYTKPSAIKSVVFQMRDSLYDIIKYRNGNWHNAYVITTGALKGDRDRLKARISADELIFIDASYMDCIKRATVRNYSEDEKLKWFGYIDDFFQHYQPEPEED